jgi:hypothetical protein
MFQFAYAGIAAGGGVTVTPSGSWANVGPGNSPQTNADVTLTFAGVSLLTLRATMSGGVYDAGIKTLQVYKGGVAGAISTAADGNSVTAAIASGDTIHFEAVKGGTSGTVWSATITITIVETGQTLGTFTVSVGAP